MRLIFALLSFASFVAAQWNLALTDSTASFRGIHNAGGGIIWASGTKGTVLRSEDDGYMWQTCSVPPDADKLDFRGVFGWNANHAEVMSSGTGAASRLYETTDGCATWHLLFENPDRDGFWDVLAFRGNSGFILGDPVEGRFVLYRSDDGIGIAIITPSSPPRLQVKVCLPPAIHRWLFCPTLTLYSQPAASVEHEFFEATSQTIGPAQKFQSREERKVPVSSPLRSAIIATAWRSAETIRILRKQRAPLPGPPMAALPGITPLPFQRAIVRAWLGIGSSTFGSLPVPMVAISHVTMATPGSTWILLTGMP